jgi:hypothetical protein
MYWIENVCVMGGVLYWMDSFNVLDGEGLCIRQRGFIN